MFKLKHYELNDRGFTLVELIVVMAILAILASLAVPRFTGVLSGAKEDANKTNIMLIERAAELYYYQNNENVSDIETLIKDGYLKENPPNPFTGVENGYKVEIKDGVPTATLAGESN